MGGKLTVIENRTWYNIEMKLWVYPSRPDRFKKTITIGPGRIVKLDSKFFNTNDDEPHQSAGKHNHHEDLESQDHDALIMVYASGRWTGQYILPLHSMAYAKVICDRNQHGQVILRGKRANFNFCRLKFLAYFPTKYAKYVGMGKVEEDL